MVIHIKLYPLPPTSLPDLELAQSALYISIQGSEFVMVQLCLLCLFCFECIFGFAVSCD